MDAIKEYWPIVLGALILAAPFAIKFARQYVEGTEGTADDKALDAIIDFAEKAADKDLDGDGDVAGAIVAKKAIATLKKG